MTSSRHNNRLLSSQQFRKVYSQGRKFDTPYFSAFFLKNETGDQRLGITVTRKLGSAVIRNRCKRRLREVFRLRDQAILADIGYDLVLNAKTELIRASFNQINEAFSQTVKRYQEHLSRVATHNQRELMTR